MKRTPLEPAPWALGVAACLFYLSCHSTFYNFDGVACAIAVELGDLSHLAHGNHLAYGLLGLLFHRLWQALGYAGPALLTLQTMDSLLGGAGVGVFCALLLRLGAPRPAACLAAAGLGVSQAWWLWSLEAQVYMLGAFFLLLAAHELAAERPRPMLLAAYHAMAVLGHAGHAMFFPAAAWVLWNSHRSRRPAVLYALALGVLVAASYAAAAALVVHPRSFEDWRLWLLGSAALTADRSFQWHGGWSWENLRSWALMSARIFADAVPVEGWARFIGWGLGLAALAGAGLGVRAVIRGRHARFERAVLIWLLSYAVLFSNWQPYTVVYRVSDLPALWVLIVLGLRRVRQGVQTCLLGAWLLAAGLFNWSTNMAPNSDPALNRPYQEALVIARETPENAWVVVTGRGQVYVPYFAHRRPLNMRYYEDRLEPLRRRLGSLERAGEPVYISSDTLNAADWKGFFEGYGIETAGREADMTLYRLKGRGSRGGADRRGSGRPPR